MAHLRKSTHLSILCLSICGLILTLFFRSPYASHLKKNMYLLCPVNRIKKQVRLLLFRALFIHLSAGRVELNQILIFQTVFFSSSSLTVGDIGKGVCFCLGIVMHIIFNELSEHSEG